MNLKNYATYWQNTLKDLLFPPRCTVCGTAEPPIEENLCHSCELQVTRPNLPCCSVCGHDFADHEAADHFCGACLISPPAFAMARSLVYYDEPVRKLLHNLKYNFDTTTHAPLLKIARGCDYSLFKKVDFILPIPLHSSRLRQRGVNHAQQIAQLLFPERKKEILLDTLIKHQDTPSQTNLDRLGRKLNIRATFSVNSPEKIQNKEICLVDDIYTTGATVGECAKTLKKAGAGEVKVLVFARVRQAGQKKIIRK